MINQNSELQLIEQIRVITNQVAEICAEKDDNWERALRLRINSTVNDAIWCVSMNKIISKQGFDIDHTRI